MRAYRYVIRNDDGSAPNYDPPPVTLAICKPQIRRLAKKDDLIIAFEGRDLGQNPHGVRWAGIVSEILPFAGYWNDPRFQGKKPDRTTRPDNIYEPGPWGLRQVDNPIHRNAHVARDLGGRNVLVFGRAWQMKALSQPLPEEFDLRIGSPYRRGHRVRELTTNEQIRILEWLDTNLRPVSLIMAVAKEQSRASASPSERSRRGC